MREFVFTWSIKNISHSWHRTGDRIVSPTYSASSLENSSWSCYLYPRGKENSDYISVELRRHSNEGPENLPVNVELSCITADTSKTHNYFIPERLTNFSKSMYFNEFLVPCFMQRYEIFEQRKALYLPQDTFTLSCRLWKDSDVNEFDQSFGLTELEIERIFLVEDILIENAVEKTIDIKSAERKNESVISINMLYCDDMIAVEINKFWQNAKCYSTCKLSLENKRTERTIFDHKFRFFSTTPNIAWRLPISDGIWPADIDDLDKSNCRLTAELVYSNGKTNEIIEKGCSKISEFLSNYLDYDWLGKPKDCPTISEDLWRFVTEKHLCDIKLYAEGRLFLIHKIVLCARSPVFLTMLTSAMKEMENGCIEIEDISADTMETFLVFLYSDKIRISNWKEMMELYSVADKYHVELLKLICCSHFMANIDEDNFCELLMLADSHNDYELKSKVNNIIWKNDEILFRSSTWKELKEDKPNLAIETWNSKYEERGKENVTETYEEKISKHPKIQDDIKSLYEYQNASDIVIKTSNNSYKAYKTILCASSLVLKDRILNECISTDVIDIDDLEDDIVAEMLFFLHTDSFKDIKWDTAKKLYRAAVKYIIHRLKFKCSCYLIENLTVSNANEVLLLAFEHGDIELKRVVKNYICVHDEEIFRSYEWGDFCEDNSCIALEMMCTKYRGN